MDKKIVKYQDNCDVIKIKLPKGKRKQYNDYAEAMGISLDRLIMDLLDTEMWKTLHK